MSFPTTLTNAIDNITDIVAAHLNNLEAKVGINGSNVPASLDYLLKSTASVDPGHKHTGNSISGLGNNDLITHMLGMTPPGLTVRNNAALPNVKLEMSARSIWLKDASGNPYFLNAPSLTTLDLSNAGSIGVVNGIKSAILAASTQYYLYVIAKANGANGLWLDSSATAPALPADYIYYRLISTPRTDASSHFLKIIQYGNEVSYFAPLQELNNNTNTNYTALILQYVPAIAYKAELLLATGGAGAVYLSMDGVNALYAVTVSTLQTYVTLHLPTPPTIYYKLVGGSGVILYTTKYYLTL